MIMQKKGFLLFLCSLIPGAGELYMGFKKRGVSMMAIFWGIVALTCVSGLEWFALALPVVWAYSFFPGTQFEIFAGRSVLPAKR